jgi:exopolyphosphatase / guanosine-5'-triphosphate,3'-diphosphate pyrophosphatase
MRLGVLDIGSNTVHLLVVDAHPGARPLPAYSHKVSLRLAEYLVDGQIARTGAAALGDIVTDVMRIAEDQGVQEVLAFATSAIREAPNGEAVLAAIRASTGAPLQVLSGQDEARLTFLAVRRWFGWSSGHLLALDIGGGSLEIAAGIDEVPDAALSLPLGAGRLTREYLPGDPPKADAIRALRRYVRVEIGAVVRGVVKTGTPDRVVGTSKTLRSLARVAGAAPSSDGPYAARELRAADVAALVDRLAGMTTAERRSLHGVSPERAGQLLAGALVADAALDLLGVTHLDICPWALREGVILRRLDSLADSIEVVDPLDASKAFDGGLGALPS